MVSSPDDHIEAQTADVASFAATAKPKPGWTTQVDTEQVFRLIDSILPFEACLYHQLLPLSLEGSRLKLGMVNLDDTAALDYVRRILAYMNCSLVPQTLATDVHHAALSAYLNHTDRQKQPRRTPQATVKAIAQPIDQRPIEETAQNGSSSQRSPAERRSAERYPVGKPTANRYSAEGLPAQRRPVEPIAPQHGAADHSHSSPPTARAKPFQPDQNSQPTFLLDSTENLDFQDLEVTAPPAPPLAASSLAASSLPAATNPVEEARSILPNPPTAVPSLEQNHLHEAPTPESERLSAADSPPEMPMPGEALPVLPVEPKYLSEPVAVLATLPPSELLVELLGRLLVGGIGRLYFERQPQYGRILWSQNGVLQSVLNELPLPVIQGVVNELKLLTHLPLTPVQKPKQVEIERLYQKQRLLLRLRVMPGAHGEEATVQVLRGAALKFYQQQQLASLSRDALTIAQELQHKVSEIRVRTRFYPLNNPDQLNVLPALDQVIRSVEQQLEALKAMRLAEAEAEDTE